MISLTWKGNPEEQIQAIMDRYAELPRHIAKKHLQAAMRRTVKDGVPILKAITPKRKTKVVFGRDQISGEYTARKVKGGALRRSVTTKAKYVGRNADGFVYGLVGYKAGFESRKAIWLEFGTERIRPLGLIERFKQQYGGPSLAKLNAAMVAGLESAARELAAGKNPGRAS